MNIPYTTPPSTARDLAPLLTESLDRLVAKFGDPTDRIFEDLFGQNPRYREMFVLDTDGGVRGSMLESCFTCLFAAAEGKDQIARYHLEAAQLAHDGYGLEAEELNHVFRSIRSAAQAALAVDWSDDYEAMWSTLLGRLDRLSMESTT